MANTMTIGRITFTSPATISESSIQTGQRNSLDRSFSFKVHCVVQAQVKHTSTVLKN